MVSYWIPKNSTVIHLIFDQSYSNFSAATVRFRKRLRRRKCKSDRHSRWRLWSSWILKNSWYFSIIDHSSPDSVEMLWLPIKLHLLRRNENSTYRLHATILNFLKNCRYIFATARNCSTFNGNVASLLLSTNYVTPKYNCGWYFYRIWQTIAYIGRHIAI